MSQTLAPNIRGFREISRTLTLLSPWLITFAVFWLYPLLYALYMSFTKYSTLTNTAEFIGLKNYTRVLNDYFFWKAFTNTAIFTIGTVPVTTTLALALAVMLNSKLVRGVAFFRAAYFMPSVTSLVVIALIFTNLYAKDGYINALVQMLGFEGSQRGFLLTPGTALASIMAMDIWIATGYYMVLFLAGLQTIPADLYEAARLAGASAWQQFKMITLPLIRPTLLFIVVINSIKSFQVFVEIYVMTKGGPLHSTTTLVYQVFVNAFEKADMMGYASALAYVVFVIILSFSLIQMKVLKAR
ncbi:MAG TPA: sugar ABC transporter permease [Patescibacteria group bacterium]|nr:sugar ABC transporter permease [Patescibacteria group bacterium]